MDGSTFQRRQTFGRDMGLSRGGDGVSPAYPVSSGTDYEKVAAAGLEMGSYESLGGVNELHGPAYSSMQSQHAVVPSSSFHFSAGFFDSPGFGGGQRTALAPVGGGYGSGGVVGSGGMDADLQGLMNNDLYGTWPNASWRPVVGFPKGSGGFV